MNGISFSRRFGRRSTRLNNAHVAQGFAEAGSVLAVTDPELGVTRRINTSSSPFAPASALEVFHV